MLILFGLDLGLVFHFEVKFGNMIHHGGPMVCRAVAALGVVPLGVVFAAIGHGVPAAPRVV